MVSGCQVLIVDDNEMNRKLAKGLLKKFKLCCDEAASGPEALEKIKENSYRLVFMDYRMPQMDGMETTEKLRRLEGDYFQKLPVVALTAEDRAEVRALFYSAGMNDVLLKPIAWNSLEEILKKWLPQQVFTDGCNEEGSEEIPWGKEKDALAREGIDVEEGSKNCGSKSMYFSMLKDFYCLIDLKSVKLVKSLAQKQLEDFTIEVHALKNTARLIGAKELAKDFADLENLGNHGSMEEVKKQTPKVLATMHRYKDVLKPYAEADFSEKKRTSGTEIVECLRAILEAVEAFDIDCVDAAIEELDIYEMPPECAKQMQNLKAYVADVALEDISKTAEKMIRILENR